MLKSLTEMCCVLGDPLMTRDGPIWVARDFSKCSGCRKCEIACSLYHENRIWPEASRVRIFMLVPGTEFPHLCTQCEGYPCVEACPFKALSVNNRTAAVIVDEEKCVGCGRCIDACPGRIPHMHPAKKKILICDLCDGDPQCARTCQEGGWGALRTVLREDHPYRLYARLPQEHARNLAFKLYGEKAEKYL
jgi:Fe-S-cluster-containing hydrogenase component 2